ncbi:MAG TPA: hypothetical protein VFF69_07120 [Phycisphaerales bacterium]|nr:hypothetical protein [Phycisphaerales bacterium]
MHGSPLSEAQFDELRRCSRQGRKLRRACGVARFNGWTLALFGACGLVSGFWDAAGLAFGAAFGILAWREFAGARGLAMLRERAARGLALNQVVLGAVVVGYAGLSAYRVLERQGVSAAEAAELDAVLGPGGAASLASMASALSLVVYGAVAAASVLCQGLTAWYYASRARLVREQLAATPEWAVRVQRIVLAA